MTIKIEIIEKEHGWDYRESNSKKVIGSVYEQEGYYIWETPFTSNLSPMTANHANEDLRYELRLAAEAVGCELQFVYQAHPVI